MTDSLSERFTALEELGSGAFSTVFRGRDEKFGREVALKVMHPALLSDATFVERFHHEAQIVANLRHPHIVTVYDYGEYNDRLCLVMDLLHGGSLADLLEDGPLPWDRALEITQQVAEALDYAHERGLVHRDVKPHNILLDEAGRVVLADFGVVRALESGTVASTLSGGVVGTAAYIPVEIWDGEPPTPQTDIYALACVVYEMVTAERLFQGSSLSNTIRRHLRPPEFPGEWPEGVPVGIEQVLARALAQDPADRYQSAGAFAEALIPLQAPAARSVERFLPEARNEDDDRDVSGMRLRPSPRPAVMMPPIEEDPMGEEVGEKGEREPAARRGGGLPRWALPVAGVLVVLLIVGGILLFGGGDGRVSPTATISMAATAVATPVEAAMQPAAMQPPATETATFPPAPTAEPTATATTEPTRTPEATATLDGGARAGSVGEGDDEEEVTSDDVTVNVEADLIAELVGHINTVSSATFSPDGERVLTASSDRTARLWDGHTGAPLTVLDGHGSRVFSAAFSPDGERIVTASNDETARLWDGQTGAPLSVLEGHVNEVATAAFSPDGERLVTASFTNVRLWDKDGESIISFFPHEPRFVGSVAFSPDGERLLTAGNDGTARIWVAVGDQVGDQLQVLEGHTAEVWSAVFSPDGERVVTASLDGTARLWDAEGASTAVLEGHSSWVSSASFSPDGERVVTSSFDGTARLWDATGTLLAVLRGNTHHRVWLAAFSPDGVLVVTASEDGTARLWDGHTGAQLAVLEGHTDAVFEASFSPDGERLVTVSRYGPARLWALHYD